MIIRTAFLMVRAYLTLSEKGNSMGINKKKIIRININVVNANIRRQLTRILRTLK